MILIYTDATDVEIILFIYVILYGLFIFSVTGLVCAAVLGKLSKKAGNVKEQVLSNDLEKHSK